MLRDRHNDQSEQPSHERCLETYNSAAFTLCRRKSFAAKTSLINSTAPLSRWMRAFALRVVQRPASTEMNSGGVCY